MKLVLEYIRVKPYAVLSSSLSMRAWGELQEDVCEENEIWIDSGRLLVSSTCGRNYERPKHLRLLYVRHGVCFVKDEMHPTYAVCVVNANNIKHVARMLW